MSLHNFLVEIGTEELPPTQLLQISADFTSGLEKALEQANLEFAEIKPFATPRRIACLVTGLASTAKNQLIEKRGPAKSSCFNPDGSVSKAAEGWCKANGINFADATFLETEKGAWLYYSFEKEGTAAVALLPEIVEKAVANIQIAKGMRWGNNEFTFIRPVHTFTMLLDEQVIDGELFGIKASNRILGHRFLGEKEFTLANATDYEAELLNKGKVIANFEARKAAILEQVANLAQGLSAYTSISGSEDDLVNEITSLVELPRAMVASYEEEFLAVPKEALILTMQGDQRYFPLFKDQDCKELIPNFIFVSNINPADPSLVISGNEKVIRPRLSDAKFFYEQDLKSPLETRLPKLQTVVFQKELGTLYDKTLRLEQLATYIAGEINSDVNYAARAAKLSKCDLMTNMVFEFTDTQGLMGMYYAQKFNEPVEVAQALFEQYLPRYSGDQLPETVTGTILALADKIDTLVGIFGINQIPKGSKDPFALRRQSIAIVRLLAEGGYNLDLKDLLTKSIEIYGEKLKVEKAQLLATILEFVNSRLPALYGEQGYSYDELQAVSALNITNPLEFKHRLEVIRQFKANPAIVDLVAANKRVRNFLEKSSEVSIGEVNPDLLVDVAEQNLYQVLLQLEAKSAELLANKEYASFLAELAATRNEINAFFENVMINAEDVKVKENRYALLSKINQLFSLVADLSVLVVE